MFQPSSKWTQEERDKVMEELFSKIKAHFQREDIQEGKRLITTEFPNHVGRIVCCLLTYTAEELEQVRDDMLWKPRG